MSLTSYRAAPPRVRCGCDIWGERGWEWWWAGETWQRPTLPCLKTQYHRRRGFSRPSSGWDRVFAPRYNHQVASAHHHRVKNSFLDWVSVENCVGNCPQGLIPVRGRAWSDKPVRLLVPVSFMSYDTSTSGLLTWWSTTAFIGRTYFEVGFPLRCVQRLSRPYLATRRCRWRDNRYTRGTSIPVLSY